jgi:hypothetical protein
MRVNGVVHNPHFYQWQRAGGGAAPIQTPGAQACGGLPGLWQFRRQLNRAMTGDPYKGNRISESIIQLHQGCGHFQHWELNRLRRACQGATDNTPLRIQYLCKEITEKKLMQKIQQRDKMREKKLAQLQVYELLNTIFLENLNDIQQLLLTEGVEEDKATAAAKKRNLVKTCIKNLDRCHKVRVYSNKQLARISRVYNQTVGMIDGRFRSQSYKNQNENSIQERFITIPSMEQPELLVH